jgi:hypothetical protein
MMAVHGLVKHSQNNECKNSAINYFRISSSVLYLSAYLGESFNISNVIKSILPDPSSSGPIFRRVL